MHDVMRKSKENMTGSERKTNRLFTLGIAFSVALPLTAGGVVACFWGINDWSLLVILIMFGVGGAVATLLERSQKRFNSSTKWAAEQWSQEVADSTIEPPIFAWEPNDLSIFQTLREAEAYFEPWIVEEPEEFFDVRGTPLVAIPHPQFYNVILRVNPESKGEGPARFQQILLTYLQITNTVPAGAEQLDLTALVAAVLAAHPFDR